MTNLERLVQKDPKRIAGILADNTCVDIDTLELVDSIGDCANCKFDRKSYGTACYRKMYEWLLEEVKE